MTILFCFIVDSLTANIVKFSNFSYQNAILVEYDADVTTECQAVPCTSLILETKKGKFCTYVVKTDTTTWPADINYQTCQIDSKNVLIINPNRKFLQDFTPAFEFQTFTADSKEVMDRVVSNLDKLLDLQAGEDEMLIQHTPGMKFISNSAKTHFILQINSTIYIFDKDFALKGQIEQKKLVILNITATESLLFVQYADRDYNMSVYQLNDAVYVTSYATNGTITNTTSQFPPVTRQFATNNCTDSFFAYEVSHDNFYTFVACSAAQRTITSFTGTSLEDITPNITIFNTGAVSIIHFQKNALDVFRGSHTYLYESETASNRIGQAMVFDQATQQLLISSGTESKLFIYNISDFDSEASQFTAIAGKLYDNGIIDDIQIIIEGIVISFSGKYYLFQRDSNGYPDITLDIVAVDEALISGQFYSNFQGNMVGILSDSQVEQIQFLQLIDIAEKDQLIQFNKKIKQMLVIAQVMPLNAITWSVQHSVGLKDIKLPSFDNFKNSDFRKLLLLNGSIYVFNILHNNSNSILCKYYYKLFDQVPTGFFINPTTLKKRVQSNFGVGDPAQFKLSFASNPNCNLYQFKINNFGALLIPTQYVKSGNDCTTDIILPYKANLYRFQAINYDNSQSILNNTNSFDLTAEPGPVESLVNAFVQPMILRNTSQYTLKLVLSDKYGNKVSGANQAACSRFNACMFNITNQNEPIYENYTGRFVENISFVLSNGYCEFSEQQSSPGKYIIKFNITNSVTGKQEFMKLSDQVGQQLIYTVNPPPDIFKFDTAAIIILIVYSLFVVFCVIGIPFLIYLCVEPNARPKGCKKAKRIADGENHIVNGVELHDTRYYIDEDKKEKEHVGLGKIQIRGTSMKDSYQSINNFSQSDVVIGDKQIAVLLMKEDVSDCGSFSAQQFVTFISLFGGNMQEKLKYRGEQCSLFIATFQRGEEAEDYMHELILWQKLSKKSVSALKIKGIYKIRQDELNKELLFCASLHQMMFNLGQYSAIILVCEPYQEKLVRAPLPQLQECVKFVNKLHEARPSRLHGFIAQSIVRNNNEILLCPPRFHGVNYLLQGVADFSQDERDFEDVVDPRLSWSQIIDQVGLVMVADNTRSSLQTLNAVDE